MLKRITIYTFAIIVLGATARADTWDLDKVHSSIGFSVRHLAISKVLGEFREYEGQAEFDPENLEKGSVDISIKTASIDTENQKRDDHLRNADFFDVEKFPEITFKSRKIIKGEGSNLKIVGDLTIKDVTKEVILDGEFNGSVKDPWGGTRAGFSLTAEINRQDFGMTWNKALETGGFVVSDEVKIIIEMELLKAN